LRYFRGAKGDRPENDQSTHSNEGRPIMKHSLAILSLALIASSAFGQGQTLNKSFMHGGIARNYTLFVPSGYTQQVDAPLVVNLHGYTLNRSFQMTNSGMNAVAEREGFLVAYPDAVNADWFGPQDNIGFVDRLLEDVSSQYSINDAKVYATGFSQGGMMTYLLSVERPYTFAAVASVGGTRPIGPDNVFVPPNIAATPSRPFPLLHMHGSSDPIVPYNGGVSTVGSLTLNFPPVQRGIHDYALNNGGDITPTIVDLPNSNTGDATTVQLHTYDGGDYIDTTGNAREAEVLHYRIQNGGHNWPGDSTSWPGWAAPINYDISASNEIWKFFSQHEVAVIPVSTWNVDADGDWSLAANWSAAVPNTADARAVLGGAISQPRTVSLDVPIQLGRVTFDSARGYTVAGANTLTISASTGAQINVARGSHTIGAPVRLADDTVISVSSADSNLSITGGLNAEGVNVTKTGAGVLRVNQVKAARLSIEAGRMQIVPGPGTSGTEASVVSTLSIAGGSAPTATLDLASGSAVIDYTGASPAPTIRQQIIAGRGGSGPSANWTGNGIASSAAAATNAAQADSRSIGYAENGNLPLGRYSSFHGQPVDVTSLLVGYTRTGDANLDGIVNDDDVTIVGATYAPGVPQPLWALGDFDYNGFVDDDDVTLLGAFYDPSALPIAAATLAESRGPAAVPEPSAFVLFAVATVVLIFSIRRVGKRPRNA
jgi:polyhydroxybutyrate depolymerase